jgi:uncharacterized membrane protein (UPF0136 family)
LLFLDLIFFGTLFKILFQMKKHSLVSMLCGTAFGVLFMAATAVAQPGGGGPQPGATDVPVDGGISLLLAAGGAYGLKRLRNRKAKA